MKSILKVLLVIVFFTSICLQFMFYRIKTSRSNTITLIQGDTVVTGYGKAVTGYGKVVTGHGKAVTKNYTFNLHRFERNYCSHIYGDVAILQVLVGENYVNSYLFNALQSMRCYASLRNYTLYQIIVKEKTNEILSGLADTSVIGPCRKYDHNFLQFRHCLSSQLLWKHDYIIFIDGDSGVVNPRHCFEEYIDSRVDLSFLVRVHSGELQSGHYIAKNTNFSRNFLMRLANFSIKGGEQFSIHERVSDMFLSPQQQKVCNFLRKDYWVWVKCIIRELRSRKLPLRDRSLKLFARAQTFVRDGWTTDFMWSDHDFLLHAMKGPDDVLFSRKLQTEDCPTNTTSWYLPLRDKFYVNDKEKMKEIWSRKDKYYHRIFKQFSLSDDISLCWPNCQHIIKF